MRIAQIVGSFRQHARRETADNVEVPRLSRTLPSFQKTECMVLKRHDIADNLGKRLLKVSDCQASRLASELIKRFAAYIASISCGTES
jgi:hypothetical protein